MKLMHTLFATPIVFKENSIPVLVFENPVVFRNMTAELIRQSEGESGRFVLSSEDKPLDCAGHLNVFFDYAHLASVEKRVQTKALTLFLQEIRETMAKDIYELSRSVREFMGKLATVSEYPVAYEQGENLSALLKAMDFRIDLDGLPPCEALYEQLVLLQKLSGKQCFVLINAHSYFSAEELALLFKMAQYQKTPLLLLESHAVSGRLACEEVILFDEDMCQLSLDSEEDME